MSVSLPLDALFAGKVATPWPDKAPSAIGKVPIRKGTVTVTGLAEDAQADLEAHGGEGKALHAYPADHYAAWRAELGENARFAPGGFGENLSIAGWTEEDVCIGDVWEVGTARLQISQGRQPCWKLAAHVGDKTMVKRLRRTGRTGWYLRVLREGAIAPGDIVTRTERPHPEVTIARAARAIFDPRTPDDEARFLADLPALDASWRDVLLGRMERRA